ncbi:MAG: GH1 family beta-glucosidase [Polyangiaceae bacterium]
MTSTRAVFPPGFVWGSATSSYQIEGGATEDGRGESIWDRFCKTPSNIRDASNGDVACDHYHRWREDIALMKELGHRAYRFSVAWPRVLPAGRGLLEERGLDFYSRLVDGLLAAGITPYVTLYHWDLPQALQDHGGWASRYTAEAFAEYTDAVSRCLGDRVKHWITHNEPWCASMVAHEKGAHAPGLRDGAVALQASHHLLLSHGLAVRVLRANSRGCEVGITLNLSPAHAASQDPADVDAQRRYDGYINRWFLDPVYRGAYPADIVRDYTEAGLWSRQDATLVRPGDLHTIAAPTDFLGINYYNRAVVRTDPDAGRDNLPRCEQVPQPGPHTDIGWEVYAEGMFETLMRVHREYRPAKIYITENGASYADRPDAHGRVEDAKRISFLRDHLKATHRAMREGVRVAGYFAWSLMDNFVWSHGYEERFGLTWVDYATQKRTPKASAHWYRGVIAENAVD